MDDVIKFIFFIVAAIFLVSYVQQNGPLLGGASSYTISGNPVPVERTAAYTRSYDHNNDGTISDTEYQQGELDRIEAEIAQISKAVQKALDEQNQSVYHGMITLRSGNTYATESRKEYLTIEAAQNNTAPIVISGWKLESLVSGIRVTIPKGVAVLEASHPSRGEQNIFLAPGERAIVNSRYAVGINTSFLENKCAGYVDRTYHFSPSVSQSCPRLKNEDLASFGITPDAFSKPNQYDACMNDIERTGQCQKGTYGSTTPSFCRTFIKKYSTYDGCLELHRTDSDFFGKTWRIFLNSSKEIWRNKREAIILIDDAGKVVDVLKLY